MGGRVTYQLGVDELVAKFLWKVHLSVRMATLDAGSDRCDVFFRSSLQMYIFILGQIEVPVKLWLQTFEHVFARRLSLLENCSKPLIKYQKTQ